MMVPEGYKYVEVAAAQAAKKQARICGDLILEERHANVSMILICDGIGSGARANLACHLFGKRLFGLMHQGYTARQACGRLMESMHRARSEDVLFAAFTLVRVLADGNVTILSYEMPAPIYYDRVRAYVAEQRHFTMSHEVLAESNFQLRENNGIVICSDGVTQAGLGVGASLGWGSANLAEYVSDILAAGVKNKDLPQSIVSEARLISEGIYGDDTTAVVISARTGNSVTVLAGPANDPNDDDAVVQEFLDNPGIKVICGSTTADIVCRYLGTKPKLLNTAPGFNPPQYEVEGIDLVTEGSFALNQLRNMLDNPPDELDEDSCMSKLYRLLTTADRIEFIVGNAYNPGNKAMIFRQLGILSKLDMVEHIAAALRQRGKLVIVRLK